MRRKSATELASLARGERPANWVARRPVATPSGGADDEEEGGGGAEEAEAEAAEAEAEEEGGGSEEGGCGTARWGESQQNGNR